MTLTLPLPDETKAATTGGRLAYAVGDIHGHADLLDTMLRGLLADADESRAATGEAAIVVFLGDYIDRGPRSDAVIETLAALSAREGVEARFLMGNHERKLLDFLQGPDAGPAWASWGGAETMASYGVRPPPPRAPARAWEDARAALAAALPPRHLHFLRNLELHTRVGDYLFVHAGVRPEVPLEAQREDDLLWIREEFLDHPAPSPLVVVHGHTPSEQPFFSRRRIGLDTGAYATGVLTGVRLEGEDVILFQADRVPEPDAG